MGPTRDGVVWTDELGAGGADKASGLLDEEGEIGGSAVALAVADVDEYPIRAGLGREADGGFGAITLENTVGDFGRDRFSITALFDIGAFGYDLPVILQGIVIGVGDFDGHLVNGLRCGAAFAKVGPKGGDDGALIGGIFP